MNAQELYEELKDAANYFGVGFVGMKEINITLEGNRLRFSHSEREILIVVPKQGDKP